MSSDIQLNVRISKSLYQRLTQKRNELGMIPKTFVAKAIEAFIDAHDHAPDLQHRVTELESKLQDVMDQLESNDATAQASTDDSTC